jgi:hypothetical protein
MEAPSIVTSRPRPFMFLPQSSQLGTENTSSRLDRNVFIHKRGAEYVSS